MPVLVDNGVSGDFNATRLHEDRNRGRGSSTDMRLFNDFIDVFGLVDFEPEGAKFTFSTKHNPPSMSRLDNFFCYGRLA